MSVGSSVIVLDSGDASPRRPSVAPAERQRTPPRRFGILAGTVAAHAAVVGLVAESPNESNRPVETVPIVAVYIRPRVIVSREPVVAAAPIFVPKDAPILNDIDIPELTRPTLAVLGIGTMPPRPDDGAAESTSLFAHQAGLQLGKGATVVLRVEVLGTGELGRVDVEVSGGSSQIDGAAVAYAESVPWIGGMIDGQPATMWIRWGVRLEG